MELNKSNIKKILGIVAFAALFYTRLQQWDRVSAFAGKIFGYFFPFLLGGGIAFILNVPMRFLEERVVEPLLRQAPKRLRRGGRGISIALTLALVVGVLFFGVARFGRDGAIRGGRGAWRPPRSPAMGL